MAVSNAIRIPALETKYNNHVHFETQNISMAENTR